MNFKQLSAFMAGPGGLLLLVFFFLPWISVSCSGNKLIEGSGMDLAAGLDESDVSLDLTNMGLDESMFEEFEFEEIEPAPGEFDAPPGEFDFTQTESTFLDEADPKLYLIPLIGLLTFGWAILGFVQEKLVNSISGIALYMVPALVGIVIMILKFVQIQNEFGDLETEAEATGEISFSIVSLTYEFGWWMSILSLLLIFAAGAMVFLGEGDSSPRPAKVDKTATGTLAALQASQQKQQQTKTENLSVEEVKARFAQAKEHVQAKRYDEARAALRGLNHPKAAEWLQKIDELDPFSDPFA